jgi:site-specific DNA-cytosine methylase
MLDAFEGCGYKVTWNLCNSRHYVAQQRERVFIVGLRTDLKHPAFSWDWYDKILQGASKAEAAALVVRSIMEPPDSSAVVENAITPSQWAKLQEMHLNREGGIQHARLDIDAKAPTLIASYRSVNNHTSKFIFNERDGTRREIPRFVTPREAARIQGFPENFYAPSAGGDGEVGVAHFYSGIGNAVVPQVVAAIGKELVRCLSS